MSSKDRNANILELAFTKSEAKIRAKYYNDLLKDINVRFARSRAYEYHINWYEVGY